MAGVGKARQKPARIHGNMIFFVPAWTAGSRVGVGVGLAGDGEGGVRRGCGAWSSTY